MTTKKPKTAVTPEKVFRQSVVAAFSARGWECYWTWNSIHSPAGFPDLVMTKNGALIFAELKNEVRETTQDQEKWLDLLAMVPCARTFVWRPEHWPEIEAVLNEHG